MHSTLKSQMTQHFYTSSPIVTLLKSCKSLKCFQQIHVHVIHKGLHNNNYLISNFISRFLTNLKNNKHLTISHLKYITNVFNSVLCPNTCLWNIFLKGHCEYSSIFSCFCVFRDMRVCGVFPDKYTFAPLIKCCNGDFVGFGVHGLMVKYGVEDDVYVGSSLVDFYGKCGLLGCARKVFDEMSERNVVSWTTMLVAYVNFGDLGTAKRVFDVMPKRNQVSWNVMIGGYVRMGELGEGRRLFDEMPCKNVVSFTAVVDGYAKCGDMVSARGLFEACVEKDVFLWSALISGYAQNGQPNEAVKCFMEMLRSNTRADEFIMVSVMSACAQLTDLHLAKEIDRYMSKSSLDLCRPHVVAALVDMNAKCGNMERATCLFYSMPKRDLISYCSMIQGHSIHGQGADAVKLFYDMLSEGLTPDAVAFTVILTACSRAALVKEGYYFFDMMRNKYSIAPSADHYACMVDLLGRSGHLEAAYDILRLMPVEPHIESWGALLGGCRLHCDTELAEVVANRLVALEPHNASNFVLLSNVYAAADRWLDVSTLRNQMVDRGLRKVVGRSWV